MERWHGGQAPEPVRARSFAGGPGCTPHPAPPCCPSQRAGYVLTYSPGPNKPDFTFLTIAGAGHLVPLFKPVRALAMFERFLANQGY